MDFLKTLWPTSFKIEKKDTKALVINIIVWVVIGIIAGAAIALINMLLGFIPFLPILISLVGTLVDLYCLVEIVLAVLKYCDVLK